MPPLNQLPKIIVEKNNPGIKNQKSIIKDKERADAHYIVCS